MYQVQTIIGFTSINVFLLTGIMAFHDAYILTPAPTNRLHYMARGTLYI